MAIATNRVDLYTMRPIEHGGTFAAEYRVDHFDTDTSLLPLLLAFDVVEFNLISYMYLLSLLPKNVPRQQRRFIFPGLKKIPSGRSSHSAQTPQGGKGTKRKYTEQPGTTGTSASSTKKPKAAGATNQEQDNSMAVDTCPPVVAHDCAIGEQSADSALPSLLGRTAQEAGIADLRPFKHQVCSLSWKHTIRPTSHHSHTCTISHFTIQHTTSHDKRKMLVSLKCNLGSLAITY